MYFKLVNVRVLARSNYSYYNFENSSWLPIQMNHKNAKFIVAVVLSLLELTISVLLIRLYAHRELGIGFISRLLNYSLYQE